MQADTIGYDELLNRHVVARGILVEGSGPADVTDVTMYRTQLRLVGEVGCDGANCFLNLEFRH